MKCDDAEVVARVRILTQTWRFLPCGGTTSVSSMNVYKDRGRPIHLSAIEQHNRSVILFVTVCTERRRPLLANADAHDALRSAWMKATWYSVGRYVVMPDHVHLFCSPAVFPPESLVKWINFWKSLSARKTFGGETARLWQRNFWDRQLRVGDRYSEKWDYVRNNPVRAGLATTADEWEFQGEMSVLRWHA